MSKSNIEQLKNKLMSPGAIEVFRDNIPNAQGKLAEKAARRFAKMIYTTVSNSPALQKCSIASIIKSASISASLDLDIDPRGLAYLVPYNNNIGTKQNPRYQMEAQFQIGYKGLIELAYRSGRVKSISAHCIYESEMKKVDIKRVDGQFKVVHPFSIEPPSGEIVLVYATAIIEGIDPYSIVLRKSEVEYYRQKSKAPNSPAWKNFYNDMAKKTAIRQLSKYIPKSVSGLEEFAKGAAIDEQINYVESKELNQKQIDDDTGSETITDFDNDEKDEATAKKAKEQVEKLKETEEQEPEFMKGE